MTLEETIALERISVPVWAWLVVAFSALGLSALALESGAVLAERAEAMHELFHDARHFVGVPCH